MNNLIGNKAINLDILQKQGFNVPKWFFVDSLDQKLELEEDKLYAIRSSTNVEDSASSSFAGLFETYLYVRKNDVKKRIEDVFNSINLDRVKFYKEKNGLKDFDIKIGAIVQEMVDSEVSGVSFSINPIDNSETCVISSVFGVGEGLVSGELSENV